MNKLANRKNEKTKRRSNKSDWKKRWKGGIYGVVGAVEQKEGGVGWGDFLDRNSYTFAVNLCAFVCVCVCVYMCV